MMSLDPLRWLPLVGGPTPLQRLPRLSAALGGPRLWCKRDDLTALAGGGNKARKLEHLLAAAVDDGADTVVTFGGAHSNHARMTAVAARILGLEPIVVLSGAPGPPLGNPLLLSLADARIEWVPDFGPARDARVAALKAELAAAGRRVAWIPGGGSSPLGAQGYVRAAAELHAQCTTAGFTPRAVFCAVGTAGTWRGLRAGAALTGWPVCMHGVAVALPAERAAFGVGPDDAFYNELSNLLNAPLTLGPAVLDEDQVGPGYGAVTPAAVDAMALALRSEGLVLDPVYTGKALAGLRAAIAAGRFSPADDVVFLHTGGWPGLAPKGAAILEARS